MNNRYSIFWMIAILFVMLFTACEEDEVKPPAPSNLNEYIYQILKTEQWYFWTNQVPEVENPGLQGDSMEFYYSLLYDSLDRWSYFTTKTSFQQYFEEGKYTGFGFSYKFDEEGLLRVAFVFDGSPMARAGVSRGYIIRAIGKQQVANLGASEMNNLISSANTQEFSFEKPDGSTFSVSVSREEITQTPVLHEEIFQVDDKRVGYLVFQSFIGPSEEALKNSFSKFKKKGISEIILDLRYNGGGQINIAQYLGNLIAGNSAKDEVFNTMHYNQYKSQHNKSRFFSIEDNTLLLDRIFIITTRSTASASEIMINGLRPHMQVYTIGSPTHGKPVGMNVFEFQQKVLVPVTFKNMNANGVGDYFEGIPVDAATRDGLDKPFGDMEEACLQQALYFIRNGHFKVEKAAPVPLVPPGIAAMERWRRVIGAY